MRSNVMPSAMIAFETILCLSAGFPNVAARQEKFRIDIDIREATFLSGVLPEGT